MRIVKRAGCVFLAAASVFFTGCNSIIYNGDLNFKSFPPETVPVVMDEIADVTSENAEEDDREKYEIAGTNAFYILPLHENDPDDILDFKVLGYTDEGRFVYAYLTPYYGTTSGDGLEGAGSTGTAQEYVDYSSYTSTMNVLVLMSYDPESKAYTVFYSSTVNAGDTETAVNTEAKDDVGTLQASVNNDTVMANQLVSGKQYFIFNNQIAYVYDQTGNQLQKTDYSSVISQEESRLKTEAQQDLIKNKYSSSQAQTMVNAASVSISDVVMDAYYYVYIPITVELQSSDDSSEMEESDLEDTMYTTVVCCYDLDIGGTDCQVTFTSENDLWESQKQYWQEVHREGNTSLFDGSSDVFVSESAMNTYINKYTMNAIKSGTVGDLADEYPVFHTAGSTMNMELAGIPNLFSFGLSIMSGSNAVKSTWWGSFRDLMYVSDWTGREKESEHYFAALSISLYDAQNMFWGQLDQSEREDLIGVIRETLTLLAQGDADAFKRIGWTQAEGDYVLIPWICPGTWNASSGQNKFPYEQETGDVEAIFAYKTSEYADGQGQLSRYADISFADRYKEYKNQPTLTMQVSKQSTAGEASRTFSYLVTHTDENGDEVKEEYDYTETLSSYPTGYRLILPENTKVTWIESVDTGEMVAASSELGAIYYAETTTEVDGEEKTYTSIRYNNGGSSDLLSDQNVEGSSMDAGALYYEGSEMVVLITDAGMKFYKKSGSSYNVSSALWLPLEDLEQPATSYGTSKYNEETTSASSIEVTADQEEIIRKNNEEGVASDTYSADNLTMLNSRDVILSSLSGGILLINSNNGLTITLKDGAYFGAYPYTSSGSRQFMVVGYDTDEYYYEPGDVARAKCYSMDLEAANAKLEQEAFEAHLDSLANGYLTRTHRLSWSSTKSAYEIVTATADEKTANERALRLFYGTETQMTSELNTIASELGFQSVSTDVKTYAAELRTKMMTQRTAVQEYYGLAGLGVKAFPATEVDLLGTEGSVITAMNAKTLETILVELALTDEAINRLDDAEKKLEYEGYQTSLAEVTQANQEGIGWEEAVAAGTEDVTAAMREQYEKGEQEKRAAIESSTFYDAVLADIEETYKANRITEDDWDTYIDELLERVSPDNANSQLNQGLAKLYSCTGWSNSVVTEEELTEKIASMQRVRELEELIVSYEVETTTYRSYREAYNTYAETLYDTESAKTEAFQKGSWYSIIEALQEQGGAAGDITDWEQEMKDILGACTGGIVLDD